MRKPNIDARRNGERFPDSDRIDVVFVRTRLQALIVLKLIENRIVSKKFCLVRLYWRSKDEDHQSVNAIYDELAQRAYRTIEIFTADSIARNVRRLMNVVGIAYRSGGIVFSASLIFLPFAIVLRCFRSVRFRSFDDGRANVLATSSYFAPYADVDRSIACRVEKLMSPNGPADYLRSRSERHYSIYPGLPNVVDQARLEIISIDWDALLQHDDLSRIPDTVASILLGTVVADMVDEPAVRAAIHRYRATCDLHISHPRESDADALGGTVALSSPAEALIQYLARRGPITVYHFCSSAVIPFVDDQNVTSVDLLGWA